jgi:hypothetical protein
MPFVLLVENAFCALLPSGSPVYVCPEALESPLFMVNGDFMECDQPHHLCVHPCASALIARVSYSHDLRSVKFT